MCAQCILLLKHFPFLAQVGNNALLAAAFSGNVNLVRMLLEEFDCSLDEVNTVSVYKLQYAVLSAW